MPHISTRFPFVGLRDRPVRPLAAAVAPLKSDFECRINQSGVSILARVIDLCAGLQQLPELFKVSVSSSGNQRLVAVHVCVDSFRAAQYTRSEVGCYKDMMFAVCLSNEMHRQVAQRLVGPTWYRWYCVKREERAQRELSDTKAARQLRFFFFAQRDRGRRRHGKVAR